MIPSPRLSRGLFRRGGGWISGPLRGVADRVDLREGECSTRIHPVTFAGRVVPHRLARQVLRPERPRAALQRTRCVNGTESLRVNDLLVRAVAARRAARDPLFLQEDAVVR